jgi:twinkle protein
MYNLDSIINSKEAILVEGEPDALSYHESGLKHVSSVPNGFTLPRPDGTSSINLNYLDDYFGILEAIDKFYLAFDNDSAGIEGQKEFIRRLGAEKCWLVDFKDCKDANEYLKKYGKDALKKTISDAKQVPLDGIEQIKDIQDELLNFWENGAKRGATIDLSGFDEVASFEMKQYTLLLSAPGSGKSDFIDHMVAKFATKYGWKVGICSPENNPTYFHYDKIVRKILGYRPEKKILSNNVSDAIDFIQDHYVHLKQQSRFYLEDVLLKFAELVKRKGIRIFILDPFNKIKLKSVDRSKVNEYTEEYHIMIDEFCKTYDCHIFLVLHPNKISMKRLDKDTFSEKTFKMPTAYDAKGGGEHFDMSYNIIGLVRDFERNLVQIRTLKWKFQHLGTTGVDNWFGWNINNGRYTPTKEYYDSNSMQDPTFKWDNKPWIDYYEDALETESEFQEEKEVIKPASYSEAFDKDIPF